MGSLFGGKQPALPEPVKPATREDPSIKEAAKRNRLAEKKRQGRAGSILTSQNQEGMGGASVDRPGGQSFG
jgi:hypothetical protein